MGIRTIIEINHDRLHELQEKPELFQRLCEVLATQGDWRLEQLYLPGIRFLGQRHHSETLELKVS